MTYKNYLEFYNLTENEETHKDWLYNEWRKGNVYLYEGKFYSTTTGKEVGTK